MSDHTHDTDETDQGPRRRVETFDVSGPVSARITTRSGDVQSTSGDESTVRVTLRASGVTAAHLLKESEVRYDDATHTLYVVTAGSMTTARTAGPFGLGFGRRRSVLGAALRDVDVDVVLPRQSNLEVKTKSGDCQVRGETGDVDVSTASGDVVIDDAVTASVRSASGDVTIERGRTSVTATTASGDVVVRQAEGKTKVQSASGDVHTLSTGEVTDLSTASGDIVLEATRTGRVGVRSASGDVQVAVHSGLEIDVVARSVSGHLSSAIPLSHDSHGGGSETLGLSVATVSGDVRIVRA